jgi:hypothetical protein
MYFLHGPYRGVILKIIGSIVQLRAFSEEFREANLPGYELASRGIELSWQLQNNGKKGIRL